MSWCCCCNSMLFIKCVLSIFKIKLNLRFSCRFNAFFPTAFRDLCAFSVCVCVCSIWIFRASSVNRIKFKHFDAIAVCHIGKQFHYQCVFVRCILLRISGGTGRLSLENLWLGFSGGGKWAMQTKIHSQTCHRKGFTKLISSNITKL